MRGGRCVLGKGGLRGPTPGRCIPGEDSWVLANEDTWFSCGHWRKQVLVDGESAQVHGKDKQPLLSTSAALAMSFDAQSQETPCVCMWGEGSLYSHVLMRKQAPKGNQLKPRSSQSQEGPHHYLTSLFHSFPLPPGDSPVSQPGIQGLYRV